MPGLPHPEKLGLGATDGNPLLDHGEEAWPFRCVIGILAGQALDEDVLGIRLGGGEAPGEPGIAPDHQERHAG